MYCTFKMPFSLFRLGRRLNPCNSNTYETFPLLSSPLGLLYKSYGGWIHQWPLTTSVRPQLWGHVYLLPWNAIQPILFFLSFPPLFPTDFIKLPPHDTHNTKFVPQSFPQSVSFTRILVLESFSFLYFSENNHRRLPHRVT